MAGLAVELEIGGQPAVGPHEPDEKFVGPADFVFPNLLRLLVEAVADELVERRVFGLRPLADDPDRFGRRGKRDVHGSQILRCDCAT